MQKILRIIKTTLIFIITIYPIWSFAEDFHYRFIDLGIVAAPGYEFWPSAINDRGDVVGTVYKCDDDGFCSDNHVAIYRNGKLTSLQPGGAFVINNRDTLGGYFTATYDQINLDWQSALFHGYKSLMLIPRQPRETLSAVFAINDHNDALAWSDTSGDYLYSHGHSSVINYGPKISNAKFYQSKLTNNNILAGTNSTNFVSDRAFRINTKTGDVRILDPVVPDTQSWGIIANNSGYVLGYSFVTGSPYHERIGVWDRFGRFHTYYEDTTNTSFLSFNDRNQIIQPIYNEGLLYLIPRPGVRLNVADLVENLPAGARLDSGSQINNRGDIFGYFPSFFLLKRICSPEDERDADAAEAAAAVPAHPISAAARASLMARPEIRLAIERMAAMRNGKHL